MQFSAYCKMARPSVTGSKRVHEDDTSELDLMPVAKRLVSGVHIPFFDGNAAALLNAPPSPHDLNARPPSDTPYDASYTPIAAAYTTSNAQDTSNGTPYVGGSSYMSDGLTYPPSDTAHMQDDASYGQDDTSYVQNETSYAQDDTSYMSMDDLSHVSYDASHVPSGSHTQYASDGASVTSIGGSYVPTAETYTPTGDFNTLQSATHDYPHAFTNTANPGVVPHTSNDNPYMNMDISYGTPSSSSNDFEPQHAPGSRHVSDSSRFDFSNVSLAMLGMHPDTPSVRYIPLCVPFLVSIYHRRARFLRPVPSSATCLLTKAFSLINIHRSLHCRRPYRSPLRLLFSNRYYRQVLYACLHYPPVLNSLCCRYPASRRVHRYCLRRLARHTHIIWVAHIRLHILSSRSSTDCASITATSLVSRRMKSSRRRRRWHGLSQIINGHRENNRTARRLVKLSCTLSVQVLRCGSTLTLSKAMSPGRSPPLRVTMRLTRSSRAVTRLARLFPGLLRRRRRLLLLSAPPTLKPPTLKPLHHPII